MAFPVIETTNTSATTTAGTSHTVSLPSGIQAGDLLIILMNIGSTSATINALAGWNELLDEGVANGLVVFWRKATGGDSNPTFTSSASTRDASISLRISGAIDPTVRAPQIGTTAATTNPPSVTPSQGDQDYLAIAMVGSSGEQADDGTYVTAFPTNYSLANLQKTCGTVGTNLGGCVGCAARQITTASAIDPGAFSVSEAASRAQTIIVHPAAEVAVKTGAGILSGSGDAHRAQTRVKTGRGVLGAPQYAGSGVSGFIGSGVKEYVPAAPGNTYTKQNAGVAGFVGSGADVSIRVEAGTGIRVHVGSGVDAVAFTEAGTGIRGHAGSAVDQIVSQELGAGIRGEVGSGADQFIAQELGSGILGMVGSGARQSVGGGTTYVKQNAGIAGFSATGDDQISYAEQGTGILSAVGSGSKSLAGGTTYTKQNSGVTGFVASGGDATTAVEVGTGVLSLSGAGSRSAVRVKSGTGAINFVASGAKQTQQGATYAKSGSGIASFTGGGVRARIVSRSGVGILERSAVASDVISWSRRGTGTLTMSAGGERGFAHVPGSVEIVQHTTMEVTMNGGSKAGAEAESRQLSGVS